MNEEQYELLKRTFALASENNRMLHAQRRNAFLGGLIKIVIYAAFIILPLYYLLPMLQTAMTQLNKVQGALNQVQGATKQVSDQFGGVNDVMNQLQQLQNKLPKTPAR
ncbi:MAG: hypothetical protein WAX38_01350 [Minisyncoccia bacterium]